MCEDHDHFREGCGPGVPLGNGGFDEAPAERQRVLPASQGHQAVAADGSAEPDELIAEVSETRCASTASDDSLASLSHTLPTVGSDAR